MAYRRMCATVCEDKNGLRTVTLALHCWVGRPVLPQMAFYIDAVMARLTQLCETAAESLRSAWEFRAVESQACK